MPDFKKYDFVRFEIDGKFDRITYVKDVDEFTIYVDGKWYTPCGDIAQANVPEARIYEDNTVSYIPSKTFTLRRCSKEDIDEAKRNKRFCLDRYFECVELR